jgi:hypothetical protein
MAQSYGGVLGSEYAQWRRSPAAGEMGLSVDCRPQGARYHAPIAVRFGSGYAAASASAAVFSPTGPESTPLAASSRSTNSITARAAESP